MNCKLCRGRKALLLGSGELGKEVAIELQRYGVEVVACDKYAELRQCRWLTGAMCLTCLTGRNCAA